jgi:hypothetical protein
MSRTRALTDSEIAAATLVLGPLAVRWRDVRVAWGGWLDAAFALNRDRAFATFHTIHLPRDEADDAPLALMVHELVHVFQYEQVGAVYVAEALRAQYSREGYEYGGGLGLEAARRAGRPLWQFNREQQAQIAEDYYLLLVEEAGACTTTVERRAYEHYIRQLRAGDL